MKRFELSATVCRVRARLFSLIAFLGEKQLWVVSLCSEQKFMNITYLFAKSSGKKPNKEGYIM